MTVAEQYQPIKHSDYPHEPGRLHGCPACRAQCHCTPGSAQCVFDGPHPVLDCPQGITLEQDPDHFRPGVSNPMMCRHISSDMHSWSPDGDYIAACKAAADGQGITAIVEAWEKAGITGGLAEQTGGMTMVATIYGKAGTIQCNGETLGYTSNVDLEADRYDRAFYLDVSPDNLDRTVIPTVTKLLLVIDDLAASLLEKDGEAIELDAWPQAQAFLDHLGIQKEESDGDRP